MAAAALVAVAGCGPGGPVEEGKGLTLTAADGQQIAATLYDAPAPNAPGLILVHMYGSDRRAWDAFAVKANHDGYSIIAFDMRGHGDSAALNPESPKYRSFSEDDWRLVLQDIDAAKQALVASGADADRIGLVGASVGANLAALYAAQHTDVEALVLLSPGKSYKGLSIEEPFAAYGKRPSMLLTGEGDRYSADTCRALHAMASGFTELREFPGIVHGTDILDANPNASGQILQWCDTVLGEPASK